MLHLTPQFLFLFYTSLTFSMVFDVVIVTRIEPWGTPFIIFSQLLQKLPDFDPPQLLFKKSQTLAKRSYALSLASIRSCGRPSKALDKSISTAPTYCCLSKSFFQSFASLRRVVAHPNPFLKAAK